MHHIPSGPPFSSRLGAALSRWGRPLGVGRVLPVLLVAGAVAAVALGVPVVSDAVTRFSDPVALESSAASARPSFGGTATAGPSSDAASAGSQGGPVQMGVDGAPTPQPSAPAPSPVIEAPASPSPGTGTAPSSAVTDDPEPAAPAPVEEPGGTQPAGVPAPAPQPTSSPAAAAAASPVEAQVLALVNEARAGAGCAPLMADAALAAVARAHSADMRDRDFFSHTDPEGLSPFDRAENAGSTYSRAENIAFGQPDAAAVMDAWMDSAGHRANILDCDLTRLGVGVAEGPGGPW